MVPFILHHIMLVATSIDMNPVHFWSTYVSPAHFVPVDVSPVHSASAAMDPDRFMT